MLPTTIDGIIERLDEIIESALVGESRVGYFAALYNRVTIEVRDRIRSGAFEDNERMERLDVAFANRYLDAYDKYHSGDEPTGSWRIAFEAAPHHHLSVLQHLFLGMNAHIHLDLGIAATQTVGSDDLESIEGDFHEINNVLESLVPMIEVQLGEIVHRFTTMAHISHGLDDRFVNFSLALARRDAWNFARRLYGERDPQLREAIIAHRDHATVKLGHVFQHSGALVKPLASSDTSDVPEHIRVLARGEFGLPTDL